MEKITIREMQTSEEILEAYPVMKQLRTHLDETSYLSLVTEAREHDQYRLYALYEGEKLVAVTGFKPMITLYYGRFVWVCDLVTDGAERSKGYGEVLLQFIEKWAAEHNYSKVSLSSGLQRKDAHRFYEEKMGYDKVSFVFLKPIEQLE